ncbi:MAG: pyrrolo-quinoline quinone [Planctomycetaceae bacterium]|nr:pyrrolo-quinoline quinone [Planctomycetaceae bacterium]
MRFATVALFVLTIQTLSQADDWPQWGGPQRDLVWRETGIVKKFSTDGLLPRVWSVELGEGYSGAAVVKGLVYITDRQRSRGTERVLCLDANTGEEKWKHEYSCRYTVSYPAGPRSTPVVDNGLVYTIGAMGDMYCFDALNGDIKWQKNFPRDYGTELAIWGQVASPLVDGEQLITLVGGKNNSLVVSFNKQTGEELWRSLEDKQIGYAPPVIFEFGGLRQLIVWHPTAISSISPKNGSVNWQVPYRVRAGLSIMTPQKIGDRLFVASFYNGPRMLEIGKNGKSAKIVWRGQSDSELDSQTDGLHPIIATPLIRGQHIYGICSYGHLRCLDVTTGKRVWSTLEATGRGRWWNAFIVPHEDRYFIHNEQGDLIIANLSPKGYEEISRAKLVKPTRKVQRRMTIWSHPAFAMKSVFARNDEEIVRVDLSER